MSVVATSGPDPFARLPERLWAAEAVAVFKKMGAMIVM